MRRSLDTDQAIREAGAALAARNGWTLTARQKTFAVRLLRATTAKAAA